MNPEALDAALKSRALRDELLDGLDVCQYALGSDDLETEGSRALRQELLVLFDRVDAVLLRVAA